MDIIDSILGLLAILFGAYTLLLRFKSPEKLTKLVVMKKDLGEVVGNLIHLFAYAILPIVLGCIILFS